MANKPASDQPTRGRSGAVYVFVMSFDFLPGLIKVDAKTGLASSSWPPDPVKPVSRSSNSSSPAFSDGKVIVFDSEQMYRIDAVSGDIKAWTPPLGTIEDGHDVSPVVSGGKVFVRTTDARFFAYDAGTMKNLWQWPPTKVAIPPQSVVPLRSRRIMCSSVFPRR